jgi:hypothetical protein
MTEKETVKKKPNLAVVLTFYVIMAFLCIVSIEILLRLQQIFGPLYELEFANLTNQTPSDTLNHVPNASATSGGRKFDELGVRQYSYIESL